MTTAQLNELRRVAAEFTSQIEDIIAREARRRIAEIAKDIRGRAAWVVRAVRKIEEEL